MLAELITLNDYQCAQIQGKSPNSDAHTLVHLGKVVGQKIRAQISSTAMIS